MNTKPLTFGSLFAGIGGFDQDTLSWRTSQRCLLGEWETFSGRWPRSGSMQNGIVYRLPPLVPGNFATAFLSLPIPLRWTTLTASRRGQCANGRKRITGGGCRTIEEDLASIGDRGPTNPTWCEWLMGFPVGWTDLEDSGTQ
jgi:hypothetical protein